MKRNRQINTSPPPAEEINRAIDECLKRFGTKKDAPYFRVLLQELIQNQTIPIDLLKSIPVRAQEAGKTRFDQLYDAAVALVFPGYRKDTLVRLLGEDYEKGTKVWRVLLPAKFDIAHVLIRAESFEQAFARGCDYACRMSLRKHGRIPVDLTLRVMFVSERALRRYLDMRWASRTHKRKQLKLVGRDLTPKQIHGARLAALGTPSQPHYKIARYAEQKDLQRVRETKGLIRESAIEAESFKKQ